MYSVEIKETSKELSKIERVKMKDVGNAIKLDSILVDDTPLIITPVAYAVLKIHNDKATPTDYDNYLIIEENGSKYVTGSPSFWDSFLNIWTELGDITGEWSLEIYKKESKNYTGKHFISCSVL